MLKRTTIEIDVALLARAKQALGGLTTRATVEAALRQAADAAEADEAQRALRQRKYLAEMHNRVDLDTLGRGQMWH